MSCHVQIATGPGGLDKVAVKSAGGVGRGDLALGGHGGSFEGALGTLTLDLGDGLGTGIFRRCRGLACTLGAGGGGGSGGEVY